MHPTIAEIQRASYSRRPVRPDVLQRWASELAATVQPRLDELDALKAAQMAQTPEPSDEPTVRRRRP